MLLNPGREERTKRRFVRCDHCFDERVFRFEIIKDVAEWNLRITRHIGERRALEPLAVDEAHGRTDELGSFVSGSVRRRHVS